MAAGLLGGALATTLVLRLLGNVIGGMPPIYPIDIALASAMMISCATVSLLIPARRAMRVNPIGALRYE
jgi:ABC-type antimicrobial peptide transport system permease subunit